MVLDGINIGEVFDIRISAFRQEHGVYHVFVLRDHPTSRTVCRWLLRLAPAQAVAAAIYDGADQPFLYNQALEEQICEVGLRHCIHNLLGYTDTMIP